MRARTTILSVTFLGMASATLHAADLICYEPFDAYHKAALPGCNGGTGFDGPWYQVSAKDVINPELAAANPSDPNRWTINNLGSNARCGGIYTGDLAVAGLATQGGHYGNHYIADVAYQWRKLATPFDNSAGGDLWVSFVISQGDAYLTSSKVLEVNFQQIDPVTPNPYLDETNVTDKAKRTVVLRIGKVNTSGSKISWSWPTSTLNSTTTTTAGTAGSALALNSRSFVVAKVSKRPAGGSTIRLWINPAIGASEPSAGSDLAATSAECHSDQPLRCNALGVYHSGMTSGQLDEIRVGTTWASVCPTSTMGRMIVSYGTGILTSPRVTAGGPAMVQTGTNFGSVVAGSAQVERTFTISNEGAGALTGVTASLGGGQGFTVNAAPAASVAATAGGTAATSTTFKLRFAPTASGFKSDTLTLAYTSGGSPTTFAIPVTGMGITATASMTLSQPVTYRVFQRNASNLATVPIVGTYAGTATKIQYRTRLHAGAQGTPTDWTDLVTSPAGGSFHASASLPAGGWYYLDVRMMNGATEIDRATVDRVGSGEVFICSGQSNSGNAGGFPAGAPDDRVATIDWTLGQTGDVGPATWSNWTQTVAWRVADAPLKPCENSQGSPWPYLGGRLVEALGVPVGFISTGKGGQNIARWLPTATDNLLPTLHNAVRYVGDGGARAVLFHQGEADSGNPSVQYYDCAKQMIDYTRGTLAGYTGNGGWLIPWVIAEVGTTAGEGSTYTCKPQRQLASDLAYVYPGPNTNTLQNANGPGTPIYDTAPLASAYASWGNTSIVYKRYNPGVRWDGIHMNPTGMLEHARLWQDRLQEAFPGMTSLHAATTPTVTIAATDATATEAGLTTGTCTVTLSAAQASDVTVAYAVAGTATSGSDFAARSGTVTIPAGATTATITLTPIDDAEVEPDETVIVTVLDGTPYDLGATTAATVTITSDDSAPAFPTATITATDATATEAGLTTGTCTVTLSAAQASDVTVAYAAAGTATSGSDFATLSGTVTIPAGATTATITLTPIDDTDVEADETVIVTLLDGAAYDLGATTSATVTITSDDVHATPPPPPSSVATTGSAGVGGGGADGRGCGAGALAGLIAGLSLIGLHLRRVGASTEVHR